MLKALDKLKANIYSLIKVKGKPGADLLYLGERVRMLRKPVILTLHSDIDSYVWKKGEGPSRG